MYLRLFSYGQFRSAKKIIDKDVFCPLLLNNLLKLYFEAEVESHIVNDLLDDIKNRPNDSNKKRLKVPVMVPLS